MNCTRIRNKNNTSGHTGVSWDKRAQKWRAYIRVRGRLEHLGLFDTLAEAIARREAVESLYAYHPSHSKP